MSNPKTIFQLFGLDEQAKELIAKACADAPWVDLAPLDKGLSGSTVLMARWSVSGASSKFHVFKIGDPKKLEKEHSAINNVAAPLVRNFPHAALYVSSDGKRALLSQEFLGENDGSTRSLRQYIEKAATEEQVTTIVRRLYQERLIDWKPKKGSVNREPTALGEQLKQWVRKGDITIACEKIGSIGLDHSLSSKYNVNIDGVQKLVNRILRASVDVDVGPVHGDLHSQNVLIDQNERISLIDFGWTAIRWRAIDYLWLECSIKFVVASPYANFEDLLKIEDLLDDAWTRNVPIETNKLDGLLLSPDLKKIAAGVACIREEARSNLPNLTLAEYRKGLVAMSYALTTFPELSIVYLMHSLARNARLVEPELKNEGPYHALYAGRDPLWPGRAGRMVRRAAAVTSSPSRALDIGCGDGKDVVFLTDLGWEVDGVDISTLAIAALKKRHRTHFGPQSSIRGNIIRADAVSYDYQCESYDLVVAYGLYHCLDDDAINRVHAGAVSALRRGGLFAFASFNDLLPIPDNHLTDELFLRSPDHIFDLTADEFEVLDREIGEIIEDHEPLVPEHKHSLTWALFRKK